jgi:negative regulator of flagellin synthesis FlgM
VDEVSMNVNGVTPTGPAGAVEPVGKAIGVGQATQPQAVTDMVEISLAAKLAAKLQEIPDVRADLVAKVKAEIAAGTYETPERLEVAIDRLLNDILTGP